MRSTTIDAIIPTAPRRGAGSSFFGAVRRWLAYRETVAELNRLNPRELRDIGVETDVETFARKLMDR